MRGRRSWLAGLVLLLAGVFLLGGCTATKPKHSDKVQVVSSLNFYGDVAKKVGGKYVKVTNIIQNAATDPHDFEPTTKTAKLMVDADLVIENGMGTDAWMQRITPHKKGLQVINLGHLMNKKNGENPHLWYDLATMERLANQVAKQLSKKDPQHHEFYQRNAQKYVKSLQPIQKKIDEIKQQSSGKKVAVTEPVYDYTLRELGYQISDRKFALAIENETDPSPKTVESLQQDLKQRRVEFIVNNQQTGNKVIDEVLKMAKKHHVPVINVTETMPDGKSYQEWMVSQLNQISKIIRGKD
ncbi:metal ABC transporter substrate-binding protein [Pediococcus acidilactici]|uniref:metal ABC transporter solute-binding protein, Zn/Mn family n=1 Tax=Pediococcus acidilactici TaxID=1254 RepID=UPI00071AF95C|nr:zinc ABC transporter substrate-binding protein [Pediococcus acidilactici]KSV57282.1 metal ABC transporter substrate-binding protein [Pediococcus acidilactici]